MTSLSDVKQAEIIEAFKSTSRYLDDLLSIDNPYFEGMVNRIYSLLKTGKNKQRKPPLEDSRQGISFHFRSEVPTFHYVCGSNTLYSVQVTK